MGLILCPYHGPRPFRAAARSASADACAGVPCSACHQQSQGREPAPLNSFRPVSPLLNAPPSSDPATAASHLGKVTITRSPAQTLAFSTTAVPVTLDQLLPLIPRHIAALEAALTASHIIPLGPLTLLYDHPDISDFAHYIVDFAYPISAAAKLSASTVATRLHPAMRVASITLHGPWTEFPAAYAALRQFITAAHLPLGRWTRECYTVPRGPYDAKSITTIQRQLGD